MRPKGINQHPVLVKLDNQVWLDLKNEAYIQGRSINRMINIAIDNYIRHMDDIRIEKVLAGGGTL